MGLQDEYPKSARNWTARLRSVLECAGQEPQERERLAAALNALADKARDLDELVQRMVKESHTPQEVGELLIAIELTVEQIRGFSDDIDGKLYELGDRLKPSRAKNKARR